MSDTTNADTNSADSAATTTSGARRDKIGLLRNVSGVGGIVIVVSAYLSMMFGGPLRNLIEDRTEASSSEYADMARVPKGCPMLAGEARRVLSDGRLTQLEARRIASEMFKAERDYDEALQKAHAVTEAGGPRLDVPPPCSSATEIGFGKLLWHYKPKFF